MRLLQPFQHWCQKSARGEEKEKEIVNLFEKIMKENFPNLVKEIDMQRKHRESQIRWMQRDPLQDIS